MKDVRRDFFPLNHFYPKLKTKFIKLLSFCHICKLRYIFILRVRRRVLPKPPPHYQFQNPGKQASRKSQPITSCSYFTMLAMTSVFIKNLLSSNKALQILFGNYECLIYFHLLMCAQRTEIFGINGLSAL